MAEKQHYVRVTFEYGNDVDGTLTPKNTGESLWVSLPYEAAVAIQNKAIIPGFTLIMEESGKLGYEVSGNAVPPGQDKR